MILRIGSLLLLVAGAWFLTQLAPDIRVPGVTRPAKTEQAQPGYYLRDAELTEFGEDGRVRLRLAAGSAVQELPSNRVEAESVELDYLALPDQAWRLVARAGTLPPGSEQIELRGDVTMTGTRAGRAERAVVRTGQLTLDTRAHRATTSGAVRMVLGPYVLEARGLQADLKAGTLQLESAVNGHFAP